MNGIARIRAIVIAFQEPDGPPGHGVFDELALGEVDSDDLGQLLHREASVDDPAVGSHHDDRRLVVVVLVLEFADQFGQQIVDRDDPFDAPVLVGDDREGDPL